MVRVVRRLLRSRGVRRALAIDAVLTALAGVLVGIRPGLLRWLADRVLGFVPGSPRAARAAGLAVFVFGVLKGSAYAVLIRRARE
jgi:hypothetical protein